MESNENIVAIVERLVKNEMDKKDNINSDNAKNEIKFQCIKITLTILLIILGAYIYFKFFNRIYIDEIIKFHNTPLFPLTNVSLEIDPKLYNKFQMSCLVFFNPHNPHNDDPKTLKFINFNSSQTIYPLEIDNITLKEGDEIYIMFIYNDTDEDIMDELVINYLNLIHYDIYSLNTSYNIEKKNQSKHFSIGEELKSYENTNYTKYYEYKLLSNTIKDINMEVKNFSSLSDYEIVRSYMVNQPNFTIKAKWGIKLTKGDTHKIIEVKKMYTYIDRFFLLLSLFNLFTIMNFIYLIINYIKCKNKKYLEKNRLTLNEENVNNRRDINE